jgi:hypothetical protein
VSLIKKIEDEQERILFGGGLEDYTIVDAAQEMLTLLNKTVDLFDGCRGDFVNHVEDIEAFLKKAN